MMDLGGSGQSVKQDKSFFGRVWICSLLSRFGEEEY